jgi:hypothetical protein
MLTSTVENSGDIVAGSSTGKEAEIEDMFVNLDLREDELDGGVIDVDLVKEYQKEARWLAIGKVHTSRSFSADALFAKMKAVWNLSRDQIYREAGENLFIFQMHCLGDWKKVVHQGPWTFQGWALLMHDYDGREDPEKGFWRFVRLGVNSWTSGAIQEDSGCG